MQTAKLFKVLNAITSFYSGLPITTSTLDSFLTLEIVSDCWVDANQLGLTKAELTVLRKVCATRSKGVEGKESGDCKFIILAIHEYGSKYTSLDKTALTTALMKTIQNLLIMNEDNRMVTNLLHYQPSPSKQRPMLVLLPVQQKRWKEQPSQETADKRHGQLLVQLERYCTICDLYHGHINMRVVLYRDSQAKVWGTETLGELVKVSLHYQDSEDDLDVMLRDDVPHSAYLRVISQCGNRMTLAHLQNNPSTYKLLSQQQQKYHTFTIPSRSPPGLHPQILQKELRPQLQPADSLLIWVLVDGMPSLQLLPPLEASKKGKIKGKGDRFVERRSGLGCTLIEMEDRICTHVKLCSTADKQEEADDNGSLYCLDSQPEEPDPPQPQIEPSPPTVIINLQKAVPEQQQGTIIREQTSQILSLLLKSRKQLYQNMEIHRNLSMIARVVDILGVREGDLQRIVFLDKL